MPLYNVKAPALPVPASEYDEDLQGKFNNVLRLYFNRVDNFNAEVSAVVTPEGIVYPDGTLQNTAWEPSYIEAYDRTASIAIGTTPALLLPGSFLPPVNEGITYDPLTGVFTFQYEGVYALSISLNLKASNNNQIVYVYAEKNTGSGWAPTSNSGKAYKLTNGVDIQFVNPQSVYRQAGEQTRYFIYASGTGSILETITLPGVAPTVYVPAIRIQYIGG
jgi:hypothetical protein